VELTQQLNEALTAAAAAAAVKVGDDGEAGVEDHISSSSSNSGGGGGSGNVARFTKAVSVARGAAQLALGATSSSSSAGKVSSFLLSPSQAQMQQQAAQAADALTIALHALSLRAQAAISSATAVADTMPSTSQRGLVPRLLDSSAAWQSVVAFGALPNAANGAAAAASSSSLQPSSESDSPSLPQSSLYVGSMVAWPSAVRAAAVRRLLLESARAGGQLGDAKKALEKAVGAAASHERELKSALVARDRASAAAAAMEAELASNKHAADADEEEEEEEQEIEGNRARTRSNSSSSSKLSPAARVKQLEKENASLEASVSKLMDELRQLQRSSSSNSGGGGAQGRRRASSMAGGAAGAAGAGATPATSDSSNNPEGPRESAGSGLGSLSSLGANATPANNFFEGLITSGGSGGGDTLQKVPPSAPAATNSSRAANDRNSSKSKSSSSGSSLSGSGGGVVAAMEASAHVEALRRARVEVATWRRRACKGLTAGLRPLPAVLGAPTPFAFLAASPSQEEFAQEEKSGSRGGEQGGEEEKAMEKGRGGGDLRQRQGAVSEAAVVAAAQRVLSLEKELVRVQASAAVVRIPTTRSSNDDDAGNSGDGGNDGGERKEAEGFLDGETKSEGTKRGKGVGGSRTISVTTAAPSARAQVLGQQAAALRLAHEHREACQAAYAATAAATSGARSAHDAVIPTSSGAASGSFGEFISALLVNHHPHHHAKKATSTPTAHSSRLMRPLGTGSCSVASASATRTSLVFAGRLTLPSTSIAAGQLTGEAPAESSPKTLAVQVTKEDLRRITAALV
jgi:hypothetical protein